MPRKAYEAIEFKSDTKSLYFESIKDNNLVTISMEDSAREKYERDGGCGYEAGDEVEMHLTKEQASDIILFLEGVFQDG